MSVTERTIRLAPPSRVVALVLDRDEEELRMTLRLRPDGGGDPLELRFSGVTSLRFRGATVELNEIALLLAEDISTRGLERIRFHVKDYEEELVSFECREIHPAPRGSSAIEESSRASREPPRSDGSAP